VSIQLIYFPACLTFLEIMKQNYLLMSHLITRESLDWFLSFLLVELHAVLWGLFYMFYKTQQKLYFTNLKSRGNNSAKVLEQIRCACVYFLTFLLFVTAKAGKRILMFFKFWQHWWGGSTFSSRTCNTGCFTNLVVSCWKYHCLFRHFRTV
jgi:hypothetical protein